MSIQRKFVGDILLEMTKSSGSQTILGRNSLTNLKFGNLISEKEMCAS